MNKKMCNCISERENIMKIYMQESVDSESNISNVELQNKAILFTKGDTVRVVLDFHGRQNYVTKSGVEKSKIIKKSMVLDKCPFCGVPYKNE